MDFTEPIRIESARSSHSVTLNSILSPNSKYLALSRYQPPSRKHGNEFSELLPTWTVRIVEAESLAVLSESALIIPCTSELPLPDQAKVASNRQFQHSRTATTPAQKIKSGPVIQQELHLSWSPSGEWLAAWPTDTAYIYLLQPDRGLILRIDEAAAVGIASLHWSPQSTSLLVNLQYGMGIKLWSLKSSASGALLKQPMHLFPYPKNGAGQLLDFSADGLVMAILHRRDGVDHIAIYTTSDWHVITWLKVPEDVNLEGIAFAKGLASGPANSELPLLYAWESISKFRLLIFNTEDGELKREVDAAEVLSATLPGEASDFDKFFCTFPLKKIQFCGDGQIAAMVDTQDQIYLWNSVIHRLVGQISFHQLDALKAQTPIVFREDVGRDASTGLEYRKYDASYTFPLQSQILAALSPARPIEFELNHTGELLAVHHASKYPAVLWIFDVRNFKLRSLLLQSRPICHFSWHKTDALAVTTGNDHVYFWQAQGTHCIPYPTRDLLLQRIQWLGNGETVMLSGPGGCCLGNPDILKREQLPREDSMTF